MLFTRLVVLGVCLSFSIEMVSTKKRNNDGVFECFFSQMCKCGSSEKWGECWTFFSDVTKTWTINQTYQCEKGGNFPFGNFDDVVSFLCKQPVEEYKVCYYDVLEASKWYLDEVNADPRPEKREEANLIEKARVCAGTYVLECLHFGPGC